MPDNPASGVGHRQRAGIAEGLARRGRASAASDPRQDSDGRVKANLGTRRPWAVVPRLVGPARIVHRRYGKVCLDERYALEPVRCGGSTLYRITQPSQLRSPLDRRADGTYRSDLWRGTPRCPRCVYDRNCGNGNELMDRFGAIDVSRSLGRLLQPADHSCRR